MAELKRSASTWTGNDSTSATPPPPHAVLNAWQADRSRGRDAIMMAPTRELVRSLNQRARDHRLAGTTPGREVELADGNRATVSAT